MSQIKRLASREHLLCAGRQAKGFLWFFSLTPCNLYVRQGTMSIILFSQK